LPMVFDGYAVEGDGEVASRVPGKGAPFVTR
jgi:hypothetical protein